MLPRFAVALVALLVAALAPVSAAAPAGADGGVVRPIVFPVVGEVYLTDTWGAPRSGGRTHEGQDLMGDKMQPLVAAVDGVITWLTIPEASYGYMLTITDDDGWQYHYVHINNDTPGTDDGQAALSDVFAPGVEMGARVVAGQLVAYMGDSGNAESTAPHLHFEMEDPAGLPVNPYDSLQAATRVSAPAETESFGPSPFPRLAGADRVATAVEVSKNAWETAERAVVASGTHYAEALPASVLAAQVDGPLLLVTGTELDGRVGDELRRLGATTVDVVGSVADGVVDGLRKLGLAVERVGAPGNATATAVAIARRVGADAKTAVLVNGERFPDGISAASLAAGRGWPILLSGSSYVPQLTVDAWRELGISTIHIVGGPAVVGDNIEAFIAREATVSRLAGADRYGTSAAAAGASLRLGRSLDDLFAATGTAYPDALAAGPLAARRGAVTVLVDGAGTNADAATRSFLEQHRSAVGALTILGGPAAVTARADAALQAALGR